MKTTEEALAVYREHMDLYLRARAPSLLVNAAHALSVAALLAHDGDERARVREVLVNELEKAGS